MDINRGRRFLVLFFLLFSLIQGSPFVVNAEASLPNPSLPNTSLPSPSLPNPSLPNPSLPSPSLPNPSISDSNLGNGNLSDPSIKTDPSKTDPSGKTTDDMSQTSEDKKDSGFLGWIKDTYTKGKDTLDKWQGKINEKLTEWIPAVEQFFSDSWGWVKENWEVTATTALGIGLLIGGIFFPPLLVLGASVLIGEGISGLVGYYWGGLRGKELTQDMSIGGLLGLISGGVVGIGTKVLGMGVKSVLTASGASGVITSVVDDWIRGNKVSLKKAVVLGTLSVALAGLPFIGQNLGKYINPAKPAVTVSETQVVTNVATSVVKTSENSVASIDRNELLKIIQTGEGNPYDLLKRAGIQPTFSSEDVLAAKDVIMQYKPKDIITGRISSEGMGNSSKKINYGDQYTKVDGKKALKPDIEYTTNEGYHYKTDSNGRISSAEAKLQLGKSDRNQYAQRTVGGEDRLPNDDGGHLIASIFKGSGEIDNLVPMNTTLNRSEYKSLENTWKKALEEGKTVEVKIEPIYAGNSSRPLKFEVEYKIDGKKYEVNLTNYKGGK